MGTRHFDPEGFHNVNRRKCTSFLNTYLRNREYGFRPNYGDQSRLNCEMYTSICPIAKWKNDLPTSDGCYPGRIVNLEFSPDGSILVAAVCEKRCFMLFDPLTQKKIASTKETHNSHLNCIKFVDPQIFATCGNNSTIALWDVRCLKNNLKVLEGHTHWVNSIEYSAKDKLLISSSYDGSIHTWDINRYTEEDRFANKPICHINALQQIKLLPDSSKLVASMTKGFILLINNLDLETLGTDIHEFKPCMYRMMQLSGIPLRKAVANTPMFSQKRNRVEFVVDFPRNDKTGIISSIQVHPKGWNVLSKIFSTSVPNDWTCVHNIQDLAVPNAVDEHEEISQEEADLEHLFADDPMRGRKRYIQDLWIAVMHESRSQTEQEFGTNSIDVPAVDDNYKVPPDHKIHKNSKRLTHFMKEATEDNRFLKESCYSSDGRIVCSPFRNGVKLQSFSPNCDELSTILPFPSDIKLHEISTNMAHTDIVICTKFSPIHPLLVSGGLDGEIVWYQPRF